MWRPFTRYTCAKLLVVGAPVLLFDRRTVGAPVRFVNECVWGSPLLAQGTAARSRCGESALDAANDTCPVH